MLEAETPNALELQGCLGGVHGVGMCGERELGLGFCSSEEFYFGFLGPILFWYFRGSFRGEPGPSSILVL